MRRVTHPLPDWLEPLRDLLNTVDIETGADDLAPGPTALATWLTARKLLPRNENPTIADHRLALDLRAGLRVLALRNNGDRLSHKDTTEVRGLTRALDRLPLVASPQGLRPHRLPPARAALAILAAAYVRSLDTGDWSRIRQCPAEDCAWVFWDSSAKGARRWCTMRVCGNRAKARAFAQRKSRG